MHYSNHHRLEFTLTNDLDTIKKLISELLSWKIEKTEIFIFTLCIKPSLIIEQLRFLYSSDKASNSLTETAPWAITQKLELSITRIKKTQTLAHSQCSNFVTLFLTALHFVVRYKCQKKTIQKEKSLAATTKNISQQVKIS